MFNYNKCFDHVIPGFSSVPAAWAFTQAFCMLLVEGPVKLPSLPFPQYILPFRGLPGSAFYSGPGNKIKSPGKDGLE